MEKNPTGLMTWLTLVSGVVVTHRYDVTGGAPLEDFLDHYLDREKGYTATKPDFLKLRQPSHAARERASNSYPGAPDRSNRS